LGTSELPAVTFDRAVLGYGRRVVLSDVTLRVASGDLAVVLGPNGAGKTTLLRTVLGELRPLDGRVSRRAGLRLGYVPQLNSSGSWWPMSVSEFLALFCRRARRAVGPALAAVGMEALAGASLQELSGGQRQRVMLARARLNGPELLLLDEPTQSMDPAAEQAYLALLSGLHRQGTAMLIVTHLHHVARALAHRVLAVESGCVRETSLSAYAEAPHAGVEP